MRYDVLARRWRPAQFDEVIGQEHIVKTLKNAIISGRVANAYLFVGPRGTGKTSLARIFSKALNCVNGPTVNPCDKCESCRAIAEGNDLDVIEIDGASNNRVDEIRNLRETVKFAPARGKYRIYVIDEVHMLTLAAFNALLKTLEEPPPHVKFIFATTEPDKIPKTILSRCQRFDFRRIPPSLMAEKLKRIAESERIEIDSKAIRAIVRIAEGAMRDAESILDEMIAFNGDKILEDDVLTVFSLVSKSELDIMVNNIITGDITSVMKQVDMWEKAGKDMVKLVIDLVRYCRDILLWKYEAKEVLMNDLTEYDIKVIEDISGKIHEGRLMRMLDVLTECYSRMKQSLMPRIELEIALVKCTRGAVVKSFEEIIELINKAVGNENKSEIQNSRMEDFEKIKSKWLDIASCIKDTAGKYGAIIESVRPVFVGGSKVIFETDNKDTVEKMKHNNIYAILAKSIKDILGRDVEIEFTVKTENTTDIKESFIVDSLNSKKKRNFIFDEQIVRYLMDAFDGKIEEINE